MQNQSVARQQLDQRKTLPRISQQRIKELEARIQDRTLCAPFDGILGFQRISVGVLLKPVEVITTIDDVRRIKLDFTVPGTYLYALNRVRGSAPSAGRWREGHRAGPGHHRCADRPGHPVLRYGPSLRTRAALETRHAADRKTAQE